MNAERILFPTDFSHDTDAALGYAASLAADTGALLYIVHVDEHNEVNAAMLEAGYLYPLDSDEDDRRKVRDQLSKVVPPIVGVNFEHHYLQGSPTTEIIKFAERERVDLIVMASHGRTGLSRLLMGSIAEGVMRRAPCPVLVVKQPATASLLVDDSRTHVLLE